MAKINMQTIAGKMFYCSVCGSRNKITNSTCSSCGVIFKDTVVESQNGRKLGIVKRAPDGTVIGFQQGMINWKKVGSVFLWIFAFPIMATIHATKKREIKWYIIAGAAWILYIAVWIAEAVKNGS